MLENKVCLRCHCNDTVICDVKASIALDCEEENKFSHDLVHYEYDGKPIKAILCQKCGHIELFYDWSKMEF